MGIQFNRFVTKMLYDQDYQAWSYLNSLDKKVFDEFQLKLLTWIAETKVKINQLPSVLVFAEEPNLKAFYKNDFINLSQKEMKEKLRDELVKTIALSYSHKFSNENVTVDIINEMNNLINQIKREQQDVVEADKLEGVYSDIGEDPIYFGIPAIDKSIVFTNGDICYINGVSGFGKSYLMQYAIAKNLLEGQKILVAPCEMTKNSYTARLTSILYGFSHRDAITSIANNPKLKERYNLISYWTHKYITEQCWGKLVYTEKNIPSIDEFFTDYRRVRPALGVIDSVYDLAQGHPSYITGGQYVAERMVSNEIKINCKNGFSTGENEIQHYRIIAGNQIDVAAENASTVNMKDVRGSKQFTIDSDISLAIKKSVGIKDAYEIQTLKSRNSESINTHFRIDWDKMEYIWMEDFGKEVFGLRDLCGHNREKINKFAYDVGGVVLSL